jgi:quinol-cytochrome oxidoreductase complex cytochrome b subunit
MVLPAVLRDPARGAGCKLGGVLLMFASIAVLFFLPWLDTSKVKSGAFRRSGSRSRSGCLHQRSVLGWLGSMPAEGLYVTLMQLSTVYYFAYFLIILPLLGLFETPKPLPASITEAVLKKNGKDVASGGGQPAGATAAPETKG